MERKAQTPRNIGPYKRHELLSGEIFYPTQNYNGYGDGKSTKVADYISNQMRKDWQANRDELLAFWESGEYTTAEIFPDSLPWLFICGELGKLPWAAEEFD
jgi:hypothetical protein